MEIPVEKIFEYIKYNTNFLTAIKTEKSKEQQKLMQEQFEIMKNLSFEDFEKLSRTDLEKIHISWFYDWAKTTGFDDYQKIKNLYKKRNLKILSIDEYKNKFNRKPIPKHDNVNKILPQTELKKHIKTFLIDNNAFIKDVDKFVIKNCAPKMLEDLSIDERYKYIDLILRNHALTYMLKILTLQHLEKILIKNSDLFLTRFWRYRLNCLMQKQDKEKEYAKQIQKILIKKFPNINVEQILRLPIESIIDYPVDCDKEFEKSKNKIVKIITNKYFEDKETPQKSTLPTPLSIGENIKNINKLAEQEKISASTLQRLFYISYPKAYSILDKFIERGIVENTKNCYIITNKDKLKKQLTYILLN